VYSKHQELKQASKQAPQPRHESLVATEAVDKFVEESVCAPRVRVRASVILVLEGVLPAVPGPLAVGALRAGISNAFIRMTKHREGERERDNT
jgi:hypothetical protein